MSRTNSFENRGHINGMRKRILVRNSMKFLLCALTPLCISTAAQASDWRVVSFSGDGIVTYIDAQATATHPSDPSITTAFFKTEVNSSKSFEGVERFDERKYIKCHQYKSFNKYMTFYYKNGERNTKEGNAEVYKDAIYGTMERQKLDYACGRNEMHLSIPDQNYEYAKWKPFLEEGKIRYSIDAASMRLPNAKRVTAKIWTRVEYDENLIFEELKINCKTKKYQNGISYHKEGYENIVVDGVHWTEPKSIEGRFEYYFIFACMGKKLPEAPLRLP